MAITPIINRFNGGEFSPKIDYREDLEKYYSGCRLMENMYAEPYGDASNQPGTYFVNEVKDNSKKTILLPFKHSIGQAYQLEFGDSYIRFYKDRSQILYDKLTIDAQPAGGDWSAGDTLTGGTSGVTCEVVAVVSSTVYTIKHLTGDFTDGEVITAQDSNARDCGAGYPVVADSTTPCEVSSPYTEDDLYGLQYKQSADVMLITHIDHEYPVYKLSRTAHDDWTMEEVEFEYGPFLPENTRLLEDSPPVPPSNEAGSSNGGVASETGDTHGTSSGAVADTNDGSYTSYWKRRDIVNDYGPTSVYSEFTIEITFDHNIAQLNEVKYWIGWLNYAQKGDYTYNREVSCEIKYAGGDWVQIGTSTSTQVSIEGPWYNVSKIKIYMYSYTYGEWYLLKQDIVAEAILYELEGWETTSSDKTPIAITPSNKQTYNRLLDNAAVSDLGGTPNEVRIPCTGHGFLAGDYVLITGTTNYDGTYEITNVNDVNTFDIESAYSAETFAGTESVSSQIKLTATSYSDIFSINHIGALWQLVHHTTENISGELDGADEVSDNLPVFGGWRFITEGSWIGKVQLQRSYDGGSTWNPYHTYSRSTNTGLNYNITGIEETEDVLYRVYMTEHSTEICHYCLSIDDSRIKGIVRITEYINANEVKAEVIKELAEGSAGVATTKWSEGAWSDERGYPGTVEIFEERTVFGGSSYQPHTLWLSKTNDWYNMRVGVLSDSALIYTLPCTEPIKWLTSHDTLLIGTKADEWRLGSSDPLKPLTPEEPSAPRRQTGYGSADIQSLLIGSIVIFLQRMGKKVFGSRYYFEKGETGGYDAEDLTLLAEHIASAGIIQMTYQNQPESVLWCVTSDGYLIGMTFQPKEMVVGWHRHNTIGTYESASAIPTLDGEDELWVIVNRTIDGETKRYIEYFMPRDWGADQKDCFFVHSGLTFDGGDAVTITDISVGADPFKVTVTASSHGFTNGKQVKISSVAGMTDVNNHIYTVSDKTDDTFILKD